MNAFNILCYRSCHHSCLQIFTLLFTVVTLRIAYNKLNTLKRLNWGTSLEAGREDGPFVVGGVLRTDERRPGLFLFPLALSFNRLDNRQSLERRVHRSLPSLDLLGRYLPR
jgi:hypothetical protein